MRHTCPRCHFEISASRNQLRPVVCDSCGWVMTDSESLVHDGLERRFMRTVIALSAFAVVGFVQLATWGDHALEATYLQAAELTGLNSRASSESLAAICFDLKKWDCTEKVYTKLARSGDPADLLRLGKLQVGLAKYRSAAESLRVYFTKGGRDVEASYLFARALAETGKMDDASRYFDVVLRAKPGVLQITVAQNYVRYLVRHNRLDQARQVIQRIRSQGQTVSQFMEVEYKDIAARLASQRS